MQKFIQFITMNTGKFNHAVASIILILIIAPLLHFFGFERVWVTAAIIVFSSYYFREITQGQAYHKLGEWESYNPFNWMKKDRIQQVLVGVVGFAFAMIMSIYQPLGF